MLCTCIRVDTMLDSAKPAKPETDTCRTASVMPFPHGTQSRPTTLRLHPVVAPSGQTVNFLNSLGLLSPGIEWQCWRLLPSKVCSPPTQLLSCLHFSVSSLQPGKRENTSEPFSVCVGQQSKE